MNSMVYGSKNGKIYNIHGYEVIDTPEEKRKMINEPCPRCNGVLYWKNTDEVGNRIVIERSCRCGWHDVVYDGTERRK